MNTKKGYKKLRKYSMLLLAMNVASHHVMARTEPVVLEEVIVTATKKSESINDVGLSINAVTGDTLSEYEAFSFEDVGGLTAGLSLDTQTRDVSLRGITFQSFSNAASAVEIYWNDVNVLTSVAFQEMFDVQRIEVLRGPQGSTQGRTSPAGSIMIVTEQPNLDFVDGRIQVSLAEEDSSNTQFGVSVPIVPGKLAMRIAGLYDSNNIEGIENITSGTVQTEHSSAGRLSFVWEPIDTLRLQLITEHSERDKDLFQDVAGSRTGEPTLDAYDRKSLQQLDGYRLDRTTLTALNLHWQLPDHQLTLHSGHYKTYNLEIVDSDAHNALPLPQTDVQIVNIEQTNQELRLNSTEAELLDYMVGLYYRKYQAHTEFERGFVLDVPNNQEEFGLFTHNTLYITDRLRGQMGVRWQKIRRFNRSDLTFGPFTSAVISDENTSSEATAVTGSLKLLFDLSDDVMLYASAERGFRPGAAVVSFVSLSEERLLFDDETSNSLEFGFKASLLDRRAQLNGAIFQQRFDGFITTADTAVLDEFTNTITLVNNLPFNADATITGVEMDFNILLSDHWTLGSSVSYVDARFDDGEQIPCLVFDENGAIFVDSDKDLETCDAGGRRIGGEPNWSYVLNSDYSIALGPFDGFVRGLYKFEGSRAFDDLNQDTGGYGLVNAFVGIRGRESTWELSLWVKNLTDKKAERKLFPIINGYRDVAISQPRTIGLTGRYAF
jgi:iron complex outermembrane recepter protein